MSAKQTVAKYSHHTKETSIATSDQIARTTEPRAVVIGAINMDVLAIAGQSAISGDSTPGTATFCAGGVGRNIAEALARLSVSTQLISIVGNDMEADRLLDQCTALGIDCSQVQVAEEPTSSYVAIHDVDLSLIHI